MLNKFINDLEDGISDIEKNLASYSKLAGTVSTEQLKNCRTL